MAMYGLYVMKVLDFILDSCCRKKQTTVNM